MNTCSHKRIASVGGKCSDCFFASIYVGDERREYDGYVLDDMNIGGGDMLEFKYCLDCGQIQGTWPLPETTLEIPEDER